LLADVLRDFLLLLYSPAVLEIGMDWSRKLQSSRDLRRTQVR